MRRNAIPAAILTLLCGAAQALVAQGPQAAPSGPGGPTQTGTSSRPRAAWTEHYRRATISFGRIDEPTPDTKKFTVIGTGVLVATDPQHAYIVTAKHVFWEPSIGWNPDTLNVRFSIQEKKSLTQEMGLTLELQNDKKERYWSLLDDETDLAVIAMPESFMSFATDAIGFPDFASEDDIFDGAAIMAFGYPSDSSLLLGPNGLVRAITRGGSIAWTDPYGAVDHAFLIDCNILPGNSGGPVLRIPVGLDKFGTLHAGSRVSFLGIVTEALQSHIGNAEIPGVGAFGRVEPAAKVRKLIEAVARQNER